MQCLGGSSSGGAPLILLQRLRSVLARPRRADAAPACRSAAAGRRDRFRGRQADFAACDGGGTLGAMDDLVNKRVRALAADHGLTVLETLAALDKHPIELDRDQFLRRTLALELIELDQLQQAFRDKALEDRDVGSGLLLLKVAERRATLLGMNAPQGQ